MSDRPLNSPPRVTLEDLFRLKRAERPPPEFWAEFERELRQKQLAALVKRKSWWHEFAAVYNRFGGLRLPVGATAVLAVTLLSVRYYSRSGSEPSVITRGNLPAQPETPLSVSSPKAVAVVAAPDTSTTEMPGQGPSLGSIYGAALAEAPRPVAVETPTLISRSGDALESRAKPAELAPSVRSIAVQLPTSTAMEPELLEVSGRSLGFEDRAMPTSRLRHTAEALPTAAATTVPRRARLLATLGSAFAYSPEPSAPEHAKRSVIRFLAEDGWDRSMSRLEAGGDRLSIRF